MLQRVRDWLTGGRSPTRCPTRRAGSSTEAGRSPEPAVLAAALDLACVVVKQPGGEVGLPAARDLARVGLARRPTTPGCTPSGCASRRGSACSIRLVGLLRDPCPVVRRAAVLALGPAEQVIGEDGLLVGLNDADEEVRRLTAHRPRGAGA